MNAAVYLRVSKDDGSQDPDNQLPDIVQMAKRRGYEIPQDLVFVDRASGAKGRDERAALDRMLELAARGKFEAVFVWRIDRLSRDDTFTGGMLMVGELVEQYKVDVVAYQQTYIDTTGPFKRHLVALALDIAADERKVISDRTKAALARRRADGKPIGRRRAEISPAALDLTTEFRENTMFGWHAISNKIAVLTGERYDPATLRRAFLRACKKGGQNGVAAK